MNTTFADTQRENTREPEELDSFNSTDIEPLSDAVDYLKAYARERPEVAALWCLGIGFILGWKLKPW